VAVNDATVLVDTFSTSISTPLWDVGDPLTETTSMGDPRTRVAGRIGVAVIGTRVTVNFPIPFPTLSAGGWHGFVVDLGSAVTVDDDIGMRVAVPACELVGDVHATGKAVPKRMVTARALIIRRILLFNKLHIRFLRRTTHGRTHRLEQQPSL